MRALITGITGFVGSHLADYLLAEHPEVQIAGLKRWRSRMENLTHIVDRITLYDGDLRDLGSLITILREARPDLIFHLAAQSFVTTSYTAPCDTMDTNVIGTVNLLEAVRHCQLDPSIHVCSSSEVYGQVTQADIPITEACPFRPVSPYGVSKVGEDMAAWMYYRAYGLKTIRSRMFTHSGPRRGEVFVDSFFSWQLARIEHGLQEPSLRVGNLRSIRTFCDVRDAARAYWLLVTRCRPGQVFNIGGSTTMEVGQMLEQLLAMTTYPGKIDVKVDPALIRPADVTLQIPCTEPFQRMTGWQPRIAYEQTLRDMLEHWRGVVTHGVLTRV